MSLIYDALIIGAGPAGISAAIELSRAKWRVLLIDKSMFPREKVCGGFIGPESKKIFEEYGVLDELFTHGAKKVTHIHLSAPNGKDVRVPLRYQGSDDFGIGLSRKVMDQVLLKKALQQGVDFIDGAFLVDSRFEGYEFKLALKTAQATTAVRSSQLIYANGAPHQASAHKRNDRLFGVFGIFDKCNGLNQDVAMHFIDKGHAGINSFENGINVCYVVKQELFKKLNGNYGLIWKYLLMSNPRLKEAMSGSTLLGKWRGTFVDMDMPTMFFKDNAFYVGDAAGIIHPVAGGGISMGLMGGTLLGNLMGRISPHLLDRRLIATEYASRWSQRNQRAVKISKWVGALSHRQCVTNMAVGFLQARQKSVNDLFDLFHQPSYDYNLGRNT